MARTLDTTFRHHLDHLLELALGLMRQGRVTAAQIEDLRMAVARHRTEPIGVREASAGMPPDLLAVGERLRDLLIDADRQLAPDQVRPIATRIDRRLHVAAGTPYGIRCRQAAGGCDLAQAAE
jgi:hypothetical protein